MASHKYLKDYRLENVEKNGKLRTIAVYRGQYYRFLNPGALRRERVRLLVCTAVFWLCELAALTVRTRFGHYAFVILPMALAMLPFWFASMGVTAALRYGSGDQLMKRETAEKLESRFAGGSVIAALFTGASLIGSVFAFFLAGRVFSAGDAVFVLCAAAQTAAAVACFQTRGCMRTGTVGNPPGDASTGDDPPDGIPAP